MKTKTRRQEFLFILPLLTRKGVDRSSALYRANAPFKLVHVDIKDICFCSKSTVSLKLCLLAVDLLTSKTLVYLMKSRNLLSMKLKLFY